MSVRYFLLLIALLLGVVQAYGVSRSKHKEVVESAESHPMPIAEEGFTVPPFVSSEYREGRVYDSFRPIFTVSSDPVNGKTSSYFLYPLFRRNESRHDVTWSGVIAKSRCPKNPNDVEKQRIFMIYDYSRKGQEERAERSLFPISGRVNHLFGNDTVSWVLFPAWLKTVRHEENRYAVLWPFIHWQNGEDTGGGAFWPIHGHTWHKGKYDNRYWLWPLIYNYKSDLDKEQPWIKKGFLPFYACESSSEIECKTWVWPFFGYTRRPHENYYERRFFWPLLVQADGDGRFAHRWAPFYTHSYRNGIDKQWVMWPLVRKQCWEDKQLHIEKKQFLFFVVWANRQTSLNPEKPFNAHKVHFWPFFSHWNNGEGGKQFQMLSPLEPFFQHNKVVRELYSPIFAFYRHYEKTPDHRGASFLFNFITYEKSPQETSFSLWPLISITKGAESSSFRLLKGLFEIRRTEAKKTLKIFWITV